MHVCERSHHVHTGHISAKRLAWPAQGAGRAQNPFTLKYYYLVSLIVPAFLTQNNKTDGDYNRLRDGVAGTLC